MAFLNCMRSSSSPLVYDELRRIFPCRCSGLRMYCEALMECFGHDPGDHSIKGNGRELDFD